MSGNAAQSSKVSARSTKSLYERYINPVELKSEAESVPNITDLDLANIGKGNIAPSGTMGGKRLLFKYKDLGTGKILPRVTFKLRCQLAGTFWYNDGTKVYVKPEDKKDATKGKAKPETEDSQKKEEAPTGKKSYSIVVDSFIDALPESSQELSENDKKDMMAAFDRMTSQQLGITEDHRDVIDCLNNLYGRIADIVDDVTTNDDPDFVTSFMPDRPWAAMPHFMKYPTDGSKVKGGPNLEKCPISWKIKIPHYDNGSSKRANIFDLSGSPIRNWTILNGNRVLFDGVFSLDSVFSNNKTAYIQLVASEITILNSEKRVYEPMNKRAISIATDETRGVQKAKLEELKRMAEERRNRALASKDEKKLEQEANAVLGITATSTGAKLKVPPKVEPESSPEDGEIEGEVSEDPEDVPVVKPPAKITAAPKAPAKAPAKKSATFTRPPPV